jgi:hypothetical protein
MKLISLYHILLLLISDRHVLVHLFLITLFKLLFLLYILLTTLHIVLHIVHLIKHRLLRLKLLISKFLIRFWRYQPI